MKKFKKTNRRINNMRSAMYADGGRVMFSGPFFYGQSLYGDVKISAEEHINVATPNKVEVNMVNKPVSKPTVGQKPVASLRIVDTSEVINKGQKPRKKLSTKKLVTISVTAAIGCGLSYLAYRGIRRWMCKA